MPRSPLTWNIDLSLIHPSSIQHTSFCQSARLILFCQLQSSLKQHQMTSCFMCPACKGASRTYPVDYCLNFVFMGQNWHKLVNTCSNVLVLTTKLYMGDQSGTMVTTMRFLSAVAFSGHSIQKHGLQYIGFHYYEKFCCRRDVQLFNCNIKKSKFRLVVMATFKGPFNTF